MMPMVLHVTYKKLDWLTEVSRTAISCFRQEIAANMRTVITRTEEWYNKYWDY